MDDVRPPLPDKPIRFLDQLRHWIRSQNKAYKTEKTYVHWTKRFILYHNKRHPRDMGAREIEQFLGDLAVRRNVSAGTQKIALNALVFAYKQLLGRETLDLSFQYARLSKSIPVVFSHSEAKRVIELLAEPYRLKADLMYGAGLRISECCRLRIHDIDFALPQILPLRPAISCGDCSLPKKFHRWKQRSLIRISCTLTLEPCLGQYIEPDNRLVTPGDNDFFSLQRRLDKA